MLWVAGSAAGLLVRGAHGSGCSWFGVGWFLVGGCDGRQLLDRWKARQVGGGRGAHCSRVLIFGASRFGVRVRGGSGPDGFGDRFGSCSGGQFARGGWTIRTRLGIMPSPAPVRGGRAVCSAAVILLELQRHHFYFLAPKF